MRKLQFTGSIGLIAVLALGTFAACEKAPNKTPNIPASAPEVPTMKPDGVSAARVGMSALVELAHIERAIKPFSGIAIAKDPCRTMQTTNRAQWETTWKCGIDPKERGRTEITGTEQMNYDHATRTLNYQAKLETRIFADLEPRAQAHTVITNRRIKIQFDRHSTEEASRGNLTMTNVTSVIRADGKSIPGSNYKMRFTGKLVRQGSEWILEKNSQIAFDGVLFGLGAERNTNWASGQYGFSADSAITLFGLGGSACTKPIGTWHLLATGGGKKLDALMQTSESSGVDVDGSLLEWTHSHCNEP